MSYRPSTGGLIISGLIVLMTVGGIIVVGKINAPQKSGSASSTVVTKPSSVLGTTTPQFFFTADDFYYALPTSTREQVKRPISSFKTIIDEKIQAGETLKPLDPKTIGIIHTGGELKIIDDESSSSIRKFGLDLSQKLKVLAQQRPNDAAIMIKGIESNDTSFVDKLEKSRLLYQKIATDLLTVPTPRSGSTIMLEIINSLERLAGLLANMQKIKKDPMQAIESGIIYLNEINNLGNKLMAINLYFHNKGVTFTEKEKVQVRLDLSN